MNAGPDLHSYKHAVNSKHADELQSVCFYQVSMKYFWTAHI